MQELKVINPASGQQVTALPADDAQRIALKYDAARMEQPAWAAMTLDDRLNTIRSFSRLLELELENLANDLTTEVGKPLQQAKNEIKGALHRIRFFLEQSSSYLQQEQVYDGNGMTEIISYEPLGVIANISAWNYPYLVGVNVIIPALLAGNAVLYKPSEFALLTGRNIGRLLHQAGVPEDVFQVVYGAGEAGQALLDLPLDGYFFTGSYATGQRIREALTGRMVPIQLELGGKDPLYVMEDVSNIGAVAAAALEGVMYNAGQSCCAVERVYVHDAIYDEFMAAMVQAAKELRTGNPMDTGTDLGPLCRPQQRSLLQAQLDDALQQGASIAFQQQLAESDGYYFPLTLLEQVHHGMRVMTEESFGPISGIQRVANDAEAIELMRDTDYGLTASVYGSDENRARAIMQAMNTGTVYFNCCDRVSPYTPWSGRGHSGMGHTLSYHGIRAFTKMKAWHWRHKG